MTTLMLTPEELSRLTGRKRAKDQVEWLRRHGLTHRVNEAGEVILARSIAEQYLGVTPARLAPEADLNWKAMRKLGIVRDRGTP